jgi:tetratricopeptide (TPR) repeat protein
LLAAERHSAIYRTSARWSVETWTWLAVCLFFPWRPLLAENPDAQSWAQKGASAFAAGDYTAAENCFQRATESDPGVVSYLLDLANASIKAGRFAEGQHALEIGIPGFADPAQQKQLRAALADLHSAWARSLKQKYEYEAAIQQYLGAFEIDKENRPQSAGVELNNIGVIYKQGGDFQRAIQYFEQALEWRRRVKDRMGEAQTLDNMGQSYLSMGQFDKALAYLNEALPIRQEVRDQRGEGVTLDNFAGVYMGEGQYGKAIEFFEKALPILHQAGAKEEEANALAGLGGAYSMLSRYDKAAEILEQALLVAQQAKNRQAEGAILNNLGQTYENLGKYDQAANTLNQALAIDREIKARPDESACLNNLSAVYMDLGQYSEAAKMLEASLAISRELKDRAGEASGLGNLGVALVAMQEISTGDRLSGAGLDNFSPAWKRWSRSVGAK